MQNPHWNQNPFWLTQGKPRKPLCNKCKAQFDTNDPGAVGYGEREQILLSCIERSGHTPTQRMGSDE